VPRYRWRCLQAVPPAAGVCSLVGGDLISASCQLPQVHPNGLNQLIRAFRALGVAGYGWTGDMTAYVILNHLRHERIHRSTHRYDLLEDLVAAFFRLQGPFQGFDLSADSADAR
jgi:hypothetical protein